MNPWDMLAAATTVKARKAAKQALYDLGWEEDDARNSATKNYWRDIGCEEALNRGDFWRCLHCKDYRELRYCETCWKCEKCFKCSGVSGQQSIIGKDKEKPHA